MELQQKPPGAYRKKENMKLTLKVYPVGAGRSVYRWIEISDNVTLDTLSKAILDAYNFTYEHLYEFCMDCKAYSRDSYQLDPEEGERSTKTRLRTLHLKKGQKFLYHYDFGDDWEFMIVVMEVDDSKAPPRPTVIKSAGEVEQYPDRDEEQDWESPEDDEEEYDDEDDEELLDAEENETTRRNQEYLNLFEADLGGLSQKTIENHLSNVDFYLNHYLHYYEEDDSMEGGTTKLDGFLGDVFIRKSMWATPATVKTTAASIKKFYKSMLKRGYIRQEAYDQLCSDIKENMSDWQKECELYWDEIDW